MLILEGKAPKKYGNVAEQAIIWFVAEYLYRYNIEIQLEHGNLREREACYGACIVLSDTGKPREFLISMDNRLGIRDYTSTLLHECWHIYQLCTGRLSYKNTKDSFICCWDKMNIDDLDYQKQPHELEAYAMQNALYARFKLRKL